MIIQTVKVGDFITFAEEKQKYEVQAASERFLVCTKPFNPRRTVLYTIVDLVEDVRGTENLIFGAGFESRKACEEALDRLEGRSESGCTSEVSYRNRVPLNVKTIWYSS